MIVKNVNGTWRKWSRGDPKGCGRRTGKSDAWVWGATQRNVQWNPITHIKRAQQIFGTQRNNWRDSPVVERQKFDKTTLKRLRGYANSKLKPIQSTAREVVFITKMQNTKTYFASLRDELKVPITPLKWNRKTGRLRTWSGRSWTLGWAQCWRFRFFCSVWFWERLSVYMGKVEVVKRTQIVETKIKFSPDISTQRKQAKYWKFTTLSRTRITIKGTVWFGLISESHKKW